MKALLYKDFRMCWKLVAVYYVIAIGFAVLTKNMTGLFYQIWPMVMLGIVPVNLMAYEEQAGWNILAQSLPISRKMQVAEKYVLSVLLAVVGVALVVATELLVGVKFDVLTLWCFLMIAALLTPGLLLPCIFRLGTVRGRMVYCLALGVAYAIVAFLGITLGYGNLGTGTLEASAGAALALFAGIIVFYFISFLLSVKMYEKREL